MQGFIQLTVHHVNQDPKNKFDIFGTLLHQARSGEVKIT